MDRPTLTDDVVRNDRLAARLGQDPGPCKGDVQGCHEAGQAMTWSIILTIEWQPLRLLATSFWS